MAIWSLHIIELIVLVITKHMLVSLIFHYSLKYRVLGTKLIKKLDIAQHSFS